MKIVHFCLSNFFVDRVLYQENEIVRAHVEQGHTVLVVASTETLDAEGKIVYVRPGSYDAFEGARIIRLPYRRWIPHILAKKVRSYPSVKKILRGFAPDVIVFHGSSSWELLTVSKYVKGKPAVEFYIDSHADFVNSASSRLSRFFLHSIFYGVILRKAMQVSGPLLCVAHSVAEFAEKVYRIPRERIELFPLGGRIPSPNEYRAMRSEARSALSLSDDDVLIVQSGKLNSNKKLILSLKEIIGVKREDLCFVVAGVIQDDIKAEVEELLAESDTVKYIGWQSPESLTKVLCGADIYLQPGTQSVTMQHSLCCSCAVMIDDIPGHQFYLRNTGWAISENLTISDILSGLSKEQLEQKKRSALEFSRSYLDYRVLARRVLEPHSHSGIK